MELKSLAVPVGPSSLLGWGAALAFAVYTIIHAVETTPGNTATKLSAALAAFTLVGTNFGRQHQAAHQGEPSTETAVPPELAALAAETAAAHSGDGTDSASVPFSGAS
jgi:uncharacterized membrane protein